MKMLKNTRVLVLCGGQSKRLWPLSRYEGKNFLTLFRISPLETTIKRFLAFIPRGNICIVATQKERGAIRKLTAKYHLRSANIFYEPTTRNTAAAVLYALRSLRKYQGEQLIIAPVDHIINNSATFRGDIAKAIACSRKDHIVVFGVKPKVPNPNFGYIVVNPRKKARPGVYIAKKFIEKPPVNTLKKLLRNHQCFLNSGIFVAKISTLLNEYEKHYLPCKKFLSTPSRSLIAFYKKLKSIPFDKAIMERTKRISLVAARFDWSDFGNWNALYALSPKDNKKNVRCGEVAFFDAASNFIYSHKTDKKILALGISDICVVDTAHYLLVASRNHLDNLKNALKKIHEA